MVLRTRRSDKIGSIAVNSVLGQRYDRETIRSNCPSTMHWLSCHRSPLRAPIHRIYGLLSVFKDLMDTETTENRGRDG